MTARLFEVIFPSNDVTATSREVILPMFDTAFHCPKGAYSKVRGAMIEVFLFSYSEIWYYITGAPNAIKLRGNLLKIKG